MTLNTNVKPWQKKQNNKNYYYYICYELIYNCASFMINMPWNDKFLINWVLYPLMSIVYMFLFVIQNNRRSTMPVVCTWKHHSMVPMPKEQLLVASIAHSSFYFGLSVLCVGIVIDIITTNYKFCYRLEWMVVILLVHHLFYFRLRVPPEKRKKTPNKNESKTKFVN